MKEAPKKPEDKFNRKVKKEIKNAEEVPKEENQVQSEEDSTRQKEATGVEGPRINSSKIEVVEENRQSGRRSERKITSQKERKLNKARESLEDGEATYQLKFGEKKGKGSISKKK